MLAGTMQAELERGLQGEFAFANLSAMLQEGGAWDVRAYAAEGREDATQVEALSQAQPLPAHIAASADSQTPTYLCMNLGAVCVAVVAV